MKHSRSSFLSLLIAVFIACQGLTQKHNIRNYATRDGLAGQIVNSVFQDRDGYLWFATQSGISVFNGRTFQRFEPDERLMGVDAVTINQDQEGRIWIGTNTAGVFVYDFNELKAYDQDSGLPGNTVRGIVFDRNNVPWVLTSGGVAQWKGGKWQVVNDTEKLLSKGVLSMIEAGDGSLWFGTQGNGLVRLKNGKYSYLGAAEGLPDEYVFSLNAQGDSLLIGTTNQGLVLFYHGQFSKLAIPEIENAWISNVVLREKGFDVVSSSGLIRYQNTGKYTTLTEENGLASNDLYYGLRDRENNLWLSSGNGVSCLRSEEIVSFDESSGLSDEKITCLLQLKNGNLMVGTYGYGLNILNRNGTKVSKIDIPQVMNVKITSLLEIPERAEIWVGAEQSDDGIVVLKYKNGTYQFDRIIRSIQGTHIQTVTRMLMDEQKGIWVGTFNAGLFRLRENDTVCYGKDNLLPGNEVYTFLIDKKGMPWVSLYQKGVYRLNGDHFESVHQQFKLKDKIVLSMDEDQNGNVYLGTKTMGLIVITGEKIRTFTTREGLLSNQVQSVTCERNNVWLGTDQGLNKLIFTGEFKLTGLESYNEKSGLSNAEIQQNAVLITGDYVWVGSNSGLARLQKWGSGRTSVKPVMELQQVKLFFEEQDWKKRGMPVNKFGVPHALDLGYKDNHLTFQFNALTSSEVQYAYILEGAETEWTPYSDKNEVTYSNLAPGTYTFKVKARTNMGVESNVLELPVEIHGPFWQTWWFRIAAALLLAIVVFWFIRYRERRYRVQQQRLENVVTERTREVVLASERAEYQRQLVEQKNKEILDSISYAKRIQRAMLPAEEELNQHLGDYAVFYQPKDIVAGDFYWFETVGKYKMIAVADCTGHGVPGAIVSVVCYNALNRSVREYNLIDPGKILDKTREIILDELSKHDENVKDGMDISLLVIDEQSNQALWAGANNPLWMIQKSDTSLIEWKGDKQPIGLHVNNQPYTTHTIEWESGDLFIMFTDGYCDQFGGEQGKKFKAANLKQTLLKHADASAAKTGKILADTFASWKAAEEQVDDVCVLLLKMD